MINALAAIELYQKKADKYGYQIKNIGHRTIRPCEFISRFVNFVWTQIISTHKGHQIQ